MTCPGCGADSALETYAGNYGRTVELDVCHACNGLWFDGRESLMLSPGATLQLFESMHRRQATARASLQPVKPCPRCAEVLLETTDVQRGTRFSYFRCEAHGRFITFFQFLREKNLVRQATPAQLSELQARVKTLTCSNCGAPIALDQTSTCTHCQAPVCVLSPEPIEKTLTELHAAEIKRTAVDPSLPLRLEHDRLEVSRLYQQLDAQSALSGRRRAAGFELDLVSVGLEALFGVLGAVLK